MGFFQKLREGLAKTRQGMVDKVNELVLGYKRIDDSFFDELEEILILSDVGAANAMEMVGHIRERVKKERIDDTVKVKQLLQDEMVNILGDRSEPVRLTDQPTVIMVVGVNGVGKTTTIGKLAHRFKQEGRRVLLAAGDTFRAAAIDQLEVWGNRAGVEVIKQSEGSDPAAVIFDAIAAAKARKADVLICDTAGRLHNKVNLMEELKKVRRVMERELPGAPHEVLLVLDATTGQNAIAQAKQFGEATKVTGIALTKLDGTAKGGIVLAIAKELRVPVKLIGIGEGMEDLRDFDPRDFVAALFE